MFTAKLTPSKPTTPSTTTDVSPNTPASTEDKRLRKIARLNQEVDATLILSDTEGGRRGRRRMSSVDNGGGGAGGTGGFGGIVETEEERRERKRKERGLAKEVGEMILAGVMEVKDVGGHLVYTPFFKLPNKRQFPDYYSIIKHPLSLEQIRDRLDLTSASTSTRPAQEDGYEGYEALGQVKHDFDTVFGNAKRYNAPGSQIYADAQLLHKTVRTIHISRTTDEGEVEMATPAAGAEVPPPRGVTPAGPLAEPKLEPEDFDDEDDDEDEDEGGNRDPDADGGITDDPSHPNKRRRLSSSPPASDGQGQTPGSGRRGPRGPYRKHGPSTYKMTKSGMLVLDRMRNSENTRRIADIFDQLPDKNQYPDYYSMIPNPISLAEISVKVQKRAYATIEAWAEDVSLMCTNAMKYNVEGSTVYNDAVQMKKDLWARLVPDLRFRYNADGSADPSSPSRDQTSQRNEYTSSQYPVAGLPPLPRDTITPEIVAQLHRYPDSVKTAWTKTLSAMNNARLSMLLKQNAPPPPLITSTPPMGYAAHAPVGPPYASSHTSLPSHSMTSAYHHVRPSLSVPLVRYVSFAYDDPSPADLRTRRKLVKLRNMRGVKMHTVSIGARTVTVEIVAYLEESFYDMQTSIDGNRQTVASSAAQSPLPEISLRINGREIPGMLVYPDDNYEKRPSGCRWEVPMPVDATSQVQDVISIFTRKRQENVPGGRPETSETTQLYIHRQG